MESKNIFGKKGQHGVQPEDIIKRFKSKTYDSYMEEYIKMAPGFFKKTNNKIREVANHLQDNGGGSVALISIGSGRDIPNLNLHRNVKLEVTGIDINPNMTEGAKEMLEREGISDRVDIIDDLDMVNLIEHFGAKKFDFVLWGYSGSCTYNRKESWDGALEITKKGGILIYSDYIAADGGLEYKHILKEQEELRPIIRDEGIRLYSERDLPAHIDMSHQNVSTVLNDYGERVISVAGDLGGREEESIIFDTMNPFTRILDYYNRKGVVEVLDQLYSVENSIRSNAFAVFRKR